LHGKKIFTLVKKIALKPLIYACKVDKSAIDRLAAIKGVRGLTLKKQQKKEG
jgi:hypothetical protein